MILRLAKITEGLVENQRAFVSEYALEPNIPENKEYLACIIQLVTRERPENLIVGKRYSLSLVPSIKKKKDII